MWLPLAPRMLWVVRCHADGGVVVGGSCCSVLFGGAGVAGARAVWRWSAAQGLRALGRFVDAGWQDLRTMHDSRGPCSEKRPFWDTWSEKIATDCRPGTHRGGILPRQDPRERIARVYCHCQSGQERIRAQSRHRRTPGERISRAFCHRRAPRNASWRNIATTSRPRAHSRRSCHGRTPGFAPHQITAALPAKKTAPKAGLGERPPCQKYERQSAGAAGASSGYGAVQRHRRTLGNAARRNIAMADNAPRDKRRRAFCSPSFAVLFTARVAIGAFAVGSRRHLAVSLIETHIR